MYRPTEDLYNTKHFIETYPPLYTVQLPQVDFTNIHVKGLFTVCDCVSNCDITNKWIPLISKVQVTLNIKGKIRRHNFPLGMGRNWTSKYTWLPPFLTDKFPSLFQYFL